MRQRKMGHVLTTRVIEEKRSRGRQREKVVEGKAHWLYNANMTAKLRIPKKTSYMIHDC